MRDHKWSTVKPSAAGLWWYRPPIETDADFTTVEVVPAQRPFVIYHMNMTYRWLDDPHFEGREWHGPVARRRKEGGWHLEGFEPADNADEGVQHHAGET